MTAGRTLVRNIRARLQLKGLRDKDLAFWCHHSKPWASTLLAGRHQKIAFAELDRIADLFGVSVAELFVPERRRSTGEYAGPERRSGQDRRRRD